MKKQKIALLVCAFLVVAGIVFSISTTQFWKIITDNTLFTNDVAIGSGGSLENQGTTTLAGVNTISGTTTISGTNAITGTSTITRAVIASAIITSATISSETYPTVNTVGADLTLDDGVGASPSFIMQDETNETATFSKVDSGYLTITTPAADGVNILVGNLKVGNGSAGQAINGEDLYVEGLAEVDGIIYADGGIVGGAGTFTTLTNTGARILTVTNVSLTSPTVTFSAAGKELITLNSDANQTGIYPNSGTLYQVITIISGAGNNTMRFDDGTSMTIAANVTLTEAENDILTLICISADGDEWAAVSEHQN